MGDRTERPDQAAYRIGVSAKKMPPLEAAFQAQIEPIRSCSGVPGRIRTRDPLLRRQPLYPLSYWDVKGVGGRWLPHRGEDCFHLK